MPKPQKNWTTREINTLVALVDFKRSDKEIAKAMERTIDSVKYMKHRLIREKVITRPRAKKPYLKNPVKLAQIRLDIRETPTQPMRIAKKYNVSVDVVRGIRRRMQEKESRHEGNLNIPLN